LIFVFGFLFLFKFFFLNVFFAIIDKFFVSGEAPPVNLRQKLKPVFGRLCRWIEWDRDLSMEGDGTKREGPPSRAGKVHMFAVQIEEIRNAATGDEDTGGIKKSKTLNDVCNVDQKMNEVLRWSRDEAKLFVDHYRHLMSDKADFRNDEVFLKTVVSHTIEKELELAREAMNEAERHQRYAIMVNEGLARRDQDTLAKYIIRLEQRITHKMVDKNALELDVFHLKAESHKMRYSDDEDQLADGANDEEQRPEAAIADASASPQAPGGPEEDEDEADVGDEDAQKKEGEGDQKPGVQAADLLNGLADFH
jgi:hypothetical protein